MLRIKTRAKFQWANIPRADFHGIGGGGSDSFSGRRKLFWGNDDHLKSFQLVQSYLWTLGRNYRGISLDEKDLKYSLENPASASWPPFFYV